jgi:hypothetical protein
MKKNINFRNKLTTILMFVVLSNCNSQNKVQKNERQITNKFVSTYFIGAFSRFVQTEETSSGMASITYHFTITKNMVNLKTITYQEPIMCNGLYKFNEKGNILELYYNGDEKKCISKKPSFLIKREKNKFYIKGVGGEGSINVWLELSKES